MTCLVFRCHFSKTDKSKQKKTSWSVKLNCSLKQLQNNKYRMSLKQANLSKVGIMLIKDTISSEREYQ